MNQKMILTSFAHHISYVHIFVLFSHIKSVYRKQCDVKNINLLILRMFMF
jgi:hypothetical protein